MENKKRKRATFINLSVFGKKLALLMLVFSFILQPISVVLAEESASGGELPNSNNGEQVAETITPPSSTEESIITPDPLVEELPITPELPIEENLEPRVLDIATLDIAAIEPSGPLNFKIPTQAQATVDQSSGALIYEYPIKLPEGRAQMTPELSLKYNSRNASRPDGIAGLGWEASIPYIVREPIKGTQDLYAKAYFSSSLSGNLISTTDTTPSQYTTYRPETDGGEYLKYTFNSDNTWTVTGKDGKTYTFGGTTLSRQDNPSDSTQIYKWMISKIADTNGNEIQYSYIKDSGQIYPSQISYTYHASSPAVNTVNFTYTTPADYGSTVYNATFPVTTRKLLDTITVNTTIGSYVKIDTYGFFYTVAQFLKQRLLTSIKHQYDTNQSSLITNFSYSTKLPGWEQGTYTLAPYLNNLDDTVYKDIYKADFDLNGYPDLLISNQVWPINYNYLLLNNGTNFTESKTAWNLPNVDLSYEYFIADLNGDHLPDLSPRNFNTSETRLVYLNTGSSFVADSSNTWFIKNYFPEIGSCGPNLGDERSYYTNTFLYDINNDGKNDLVYFGGAANFKVYLNNGSGWSASNAYTFTIKPGSSYDFSKDCQSKNANETNFQTLLDVNGDGLLDYVHQTYGTYLNIGMGFAYSAAYSLDVPIMNRAGLADINGDSLVDYISLHEYNVTNLCPRVFLNSGTGFTLANPAVFPGCTNSNVWDPVSLQFEARRSFAWGTLIDLTADGYNDILASNTDNGSVTGKLRAINDSKSAWVDNPNGGDQWRLPVSPQYGFYFDINTDGVLDFVTPKTTWDGDPMPASKVYMGKPSVPNLLSQITTPFGAQTVVNYSTAPTNYSDTNTTPMQVVKKLTIQNLGAGQPPITTEYDYSKGIYITNPATGQKRFSGFNKVVATDSVGNTTTTYYHQGDTSDSANGEYNDNYFKIGKVYRTETKGSSGNLYSKSINKWDDVDLGSGSKFVKLAQTVTSTYDGDATHKDKAESYTYDNTNGNVLTQTSYGEVAGSDDGNFVDVGNDKFTTDYAYAASGIFDFQFSISNQTTKDQSSNKVRENKYYYDNFPLGQLSKGNLTKQEDWKTGNIYINSQKTYNALGLVTSDIDPRGKITTYTYDASNLYPAQVTNALNQTTQYLYDYSSGQVTQKTDPNNRVFKYTYDGLGRLLTEHQPDLLNPSVLSLKSRFIYTDTPGAVSVRKTDYLNSNNNVDSFIYFDGLGRKIQERNKAEGANFVVKDTIYNSRGLINKESLPYFGGTSVPGYTTYTYDALGRVLTSTNSLGISTNTYHDWKLTITDANGKTKDLYKDAYGNLVQVDEHNSGATYSTYYLYNYLGNLIKITDALNNIRNFTYDNLGRRLTAEDLHAPADATFGIWTYTYDDTGNLTQTLNPNSQTVNYIYDDLNRQLTEDFTGTAGIENTYTYDEGADGKGRLTSIISPSLTQTNAYNALGLLKSENKNINSVPYLTTYDYDRLGNQTLIINPDNSQVKYIYNLGGLLEQVQRKESTDPNYINIVNNYDYSPTGQVTLINYGNGSVTTNTYDSNKLYRLTNKMTTIAAGSKAQDLTYTYDPVGNITQIVDASATETAKTANYVYDDLYRLTSATITNVAGGQNPYTKTYTYDAVGNILTGDAGNYTYAGTNYANPHATTKIGSADLTYDNNGNMQSDGTLTNTWDYQNRLTETIAGSKTSNYTYDQNGQRITLTTKTDDTSVVPAPDLDPVPSSEPTFTISPSTITPGGTVTATWSNISGATPTDWLAFNRVPNDYSYEYYATNPAWRYANNCTTTAGADALSSGSCTFTMPNVTGEYQFRLFAHNDSTLIKVSNTVTVSSATLTATPSTANTGSTVTVNFANVPTPSALDWFGLYSPISKANAEYDPSNWKYANTCTTTPGASGLSSGSCTFAMPNVNGEYQFRLLANNGTGTVIASSNTVTASSATLTATPANVLPGEMVTVNFANVATPAVKDWIGIYSPVSKTNGEYDPDNWQYANTCTTTPGATGLSSGSCTFTMPNIEGDYQFRLLADDGIGILLATSNTVTATSPPTPITVTTVYPSKFYNTDGRKQTKSIYAGGELVATIETVDGVVTPQYIHTDNLGSTNVVTDNSGTSVELLDYYPYGSQRISSGSYTSQKKYIGEHHDEDTGLSYLNARYYKSDIGRFISQDPVFQNPESLGPAIFSGWLKNPQAQNSYSYANNNPITLSDPNGKIAIVDDLLGFAGGAIVGSVVQVGTSLLINGDWPSWGEVSGAAVTGGIIGWGAINTPATLGASNAVSAAIVTGTIGGFYGNITKQAINVSTGKQSVIDLNEANNSAAVTGLTSGVLQKALPNARIPGLSSGRGNMNTVGQAMQTKLTNGTIKTISVGTAAKSAIGSQAADLYRTAAGAAVDAYKSIKNKLKPR